MIKNKFLIFSLSFFICFLSEIAYSQTPITNANFHQAISVCLSTNPVDGMCTSSEYGAMPNWDVSNVTSMSYAFSEESSFNADISNWDVSNVNNMFRMFFKCYTFNQPIGNWNVSNVTNMEGMFIRAETFNQPIGNWDVNNVTNMWDMFGAALAFNQDIGNWDVSNVTNMSNMFSFSEAFNQPIGNWDVNNVTNMDGMFFQAESFNQDIGNWDVSNVTNMSFMFYYASTFNKDIGNWQFNTNVILENFVSFSSFNAINYQALLQAFNNQELLINKTLGADDLYYCDDTARTNLINNRGWTILGDTHVTVSGLLVCVENASRNVDVIENTYTVIGNEFDPKAYCFESNFTVTNDYNNTSSLGGEVFEEGVYNITWTAIDSNNNTSSCNFELSINPYLATEDFNLNSIFLYPNPTTGLLKITSTSKISKIKVYNNIGQLLVSNLGQEEIDITTFDRGIYFVKIFSEKGQIETKKILKQ